MGLGAGAVVIKMGPKGCHGGPDESARRFPPFPPMWLIRPVPVIVGTQDLSQRLSCGNDPFAAARIGCACAAFGIEAVGGATGVPSYDLVRQRAL